MAFSKPKIPQREYDEWTNFANFLCYSRHSLIRDIRVPKGHLSKDFEKGTGPVMRIIKKSPRNMFAQGLKTAQSQVTSV